jgi:sulfofructose kinase
MSGAIDVLGLGAVAVDDLLYLDAFPVPDSKGPIRGSARQGGGLAGTALVAARRMGRTCAYAGALGDDELSQYVIEGFAAEGVSVEHLVRRPGTRPFHSTILVDAAAGTRTILFDQQNVVGAAPDAPPAEVVRSARVLLVDHVGLEGMVRAARLARAAGIPVVADLERDAGPLFGELLALADHLILPAGFARRITGAADAPGACRALWRPDRAAVVVTASAEGCWYLDAGEPGRLYHQPSFSVREVDSNGCGDVFHGAYAAFLSEGMPCAERVRMAAAVAAVKATQPGGRAGIPRRPEAGAFMRERAGEAQRTAV